MQNTLAFTTPGMRPYACCTRRTPCPRITSSAKIARVADDLIWIKEGTGHVDSTCPAGLECEVMAPHEDHWTVQPTRLPRPKHCPICGVAMLGSRSGPGSRDNDRFECLTCDLVINYAGPRDPGSPSRAG
jgi:hypothetical protein